ncbi:DNA-binding response regulator, OmpR family, contains REC and winged-helix (wHTH) domain [Ferrithrix thermotolerans DSM 19514]|jgi:DNA-binding response OmpR family regulator|uniref:DNA-binding response regulator, OmpR family, contains REC and winged-helix (WHTH) domain n=1 Tax=Ferrithrix thermotolerans DSM 19514 TaxID=1121881 RepID=A0A1M4TG73_9ACTN|nr:response regulator transcription factor [Ferrithrix thermotolerans]SHE43297.1 DNA-binding response regulator, OmpR family, contains REC and winged-helix (wHTH) domain [Ferrithrix thermotolerans DSM 19514]
MNTLLLFPESPPEEVIRLLDSLGYSIKTVGNPSAALKLEPDDGWAGAILCTNQGVDDTFNFARSLRKRDIPVRPVLLVLDQKELSKLDLREDVFDDFCLSPIDTAEFDARIRRLLFRTGRGLSPKIVEYGPLALNLETYQAALDGRPLDLTFMEYELLKFLACHPGKVFSRETLLSRVWGYEYYGGARTVDVHVRRLRAKMGERHEQLIETVRSVGYRFGQSRWLKS